jgi:hypothetical protein
MTRDMIATREDRRYPPSETWIFRIVDTDFREDLFHALR